MNASSKPTVQVQRLADGKLQLLFSSFADFELARDANKHSHMLPIDREVEGLDYWTITFAESVDLHTLVRHLSLQLNLVDA